MFGVTSLQAKFGNTKVKAEILVSFSCVELCLPKKMDSIQNRQQTVVFVFPDQFITQIYDEVLRFLINLVST